MAEQVLQQFGWQVIAGRLGAPLVLDAVSQPPTPPKPPPSADVHAVLASGLFDVAFYAQQVGEVFEATDAVAHYLSTGAALGLKPNRLFSPLRYLATHADVAASGMEAFLHYVSYGIEEGRHVEVPEETFAELRRLPLGTLALRRVLRQARAAGFDRAHSQVQPESVAIYASALGNFFFRQIANRIASGFRALGHRVFRLDQNSQRPAGVTLDFVIAPHEFFLLGAGPKWLRDIDLGRSILFNTEQPGTPWYFRSLSYAKGAGTLVDLSPQSAVLLPSLGFPASGFLPLGCVPGAAEDREMLRECVHGLEDVPVRPGDGRPLPWPERPIDVLFLGTLTERRSRALARLAPTLAAHRCFIHAPGHGRPLRGAKGQIDEAHSRWLASQSKILLNIHRGEFPYFEWHRVVTLGAEQGTVVISEPSLPVPGIRSGLHYLSAQVEGMPALIDRLLGPNGAAIAAEMTTRCRADLAERLDLSVELKGLLFLHRQRIAHA